ncbi:MAG: signal peptide peptidase SppA [Tyzzerella sp.]|nr:signal peptide peptidase SppA [Tyzzerella sp.]
MKKKQIIGIIVTGLVIIAVGVTGVLGNVIKAKFTETEETMGFWESIMSADISEEIILPEEDFIGLINVEGEIGPSTESLWSYTESTYNHDLYMDYVDSLIHADNNKGIMLYIDSPGGTVYESDELYLKLMEYKKVTGRPIYAYFASQACSGGYYIAMAADYIVANRNCWTGSIGVIVSLLNCKDLYDKLGIEEIDITSGANKAMGSAALDLTEEQYAILQSLVDEAYDQFVEIVCDGRKMDDATVRSLADGRIYSAKQAAEHKLVDLVGTMDEAKAALEKKAKVSGDITYYAPENGASGMFSVLYGMVNQWKPKSDTELATDIIENKGNGVLKYYAK